MAKIAISLPDEMLQAVEQERLARGGSRSEFFRRAVEAFLRREREWDEQYVRAEATLGYAFAESPWDTDAEE